MKVRLPSETIELLSRASTAFRMGPSEIARRAIRKYRRQKPERKESTRRSMTRTSSEAYTLEIPPDLLTGMSSSDVREALLWYLKLDRHDPTRIKYPVIEETSPVQYVSMETMLNER